MESVAICTRDCEGERKKEKESVGTNTNRGKVKERPLGVFMKKSFSAFFSFIAYHARAAFHPPLRNFSLGVHRLSSCWPHDPLCLLVLCMVHAPQYRRWR